MTSANGTARRRAATVVGGLAALHVLPAATWLPPVRRLAPQLASPMPAGTLAVTFDDGPHPEGTLAVLDRLDDLGWPATFFMLGSAARRYPTVAREVAARGHAVGVHGLEHRYLLGRTPRATWRDLQQAKETIEAVTSVEVRWWRPPYGVLSTAGLLAARRLGLRPLLWSTWAKDWTPTATAQTVVATLMRGRVDGGVALLHDSDVTSSAGSWRATAEALELLARNLAANDIDVRPLPAAQPYAGRPAMNA